MKLKSLEYTLDIVPTKGKNPSIFLNPAKRNIAAGEIYRYEDEE